jgi:hypothetical protein
MNDKIFHLIMIVVAGVIIADFVAHAAGTSALASGFGTLFAIGTQPTNVGNIKTTPVAHANSGSKKV